MQHTRYGMGHAGEKFDTILSDTHTRVGLLDMIALEPLGKLSETPSDVSMKCKADQELLVDKELSRSELFPAPSLHHQGIV